ncbi:tRNA (cytidine32/guanosine34-2'-O)-methyltransferase [Pancytospora philotis]|nr:tRNA (cytidine32/guanosine34-2'-O)-methyltransferase [Pancytospora philotis]
MGIRSKDKRDPYYYRAKSMGYRARSAFKLLDIERSFAIFSGARNILDLCAAPGSWSQVLSRIEGVRVVAVDVQDIVPIPGVVAIKEDITSEQCLAKIAAAFENDKADLVVCDGAPDVTGFHDLDEYLQMDLLTAALKLACRAAGPSSTFVGKCFRGEFIGHILGHFAKFYDSVQLLKPKSSRGASMEYFILCRGMREPFCDPLSIELSGQVVDPCVVECGDELETDYWFEGVE